MATYYLFSTINEDLGYTIYAESDNKEALHKKAKQLWLSADEKDYNWGNSSYASTLYVNYEVLSKTALSKRMNLDAYFDCLRDIEDYPEVV